MNKEQSGKRTLGAAGKDYTLVKEVFFLTVPHKSVVLLSNKAQNCVNKQQKLFLPTDFKSNLTWRKSLILEHRLYTQIDRLNKTTDIITSSKSYSTESPLINMVFG